jgi:hypothetical protein
MSTLYEDVVVLECEECGDEFVVTIDNEWRVCTDCYLKRAEKNQVP